MKLSNFKKLVFVAMVALLVLPVVGCAPKAPPPLPPPPPAGTLTVEPAKVDQAMLKGLLPAIAKALGMPEAAAATLPPSLGILAVPVKFKGTGWQPKEIISVELVVPPDVEMKGLDRARGEDSVGIAFATANDKGDFEVTLERVSKVDWLLRGGFTPTMALDVKTLIPGNPLPNGTYTLRAMGEDARSVATTTWQLEMVAPPAPPPPATPPAAPPAGGLSFTAAEYTNADLGFSVKYPKDWAKQPSDALLFYAAAPAQVPVLFVDAKEAATFAEALKKSIEGAGGTDVKIVSEKESALADGTKASTAVFEGTLKGYGAKGFALGVQKGNKWILVTVGTVELLVPYDEAKFSEIAKTLTFTK